MQLGLIGLGRMGANMARRLAGGGHEVVTWDRSAEAVAALHGAGDRGKSFNRRPDCEVARPARGLADGAGR